MIETAAQEVKQHGAFGTMFEQIGKFQHIIFQLQSNRAIGSETWHKKVLKIDKSVAGRA